MDIKSIISVTLILFSVIDIIGSIPIIIDLKTKGIKIEALKASIVALMIMSVFLYMGTSILGLFGVDVESFAVAGAIILFFLGLEMILGITLFRDDPKSKSGTLVPIAFPLIAGAGTMTTIISLQSKYDNIDIQIGIIINIILVYVVLKSSGWIRKKIGPGGADVLRKLFGIILLAIAVKLFRDNFHLIIKEA
ncbi:MAG: multiple antibiotic resistance protein [Saprospiraceae bacterium]|jgi:multiple antibiotic resistance protein